MRIILCDDDERILRELYKVIKEYFKLSGLPCPKIKAYTSGDGLLASKDFGDIVFLDVEMPGRSGIHVGHEIMKSNPRAKVMILTSFPEYLDEAMEFRVFRYLSKPIDKDRVFRNLKIAIKQYMEENTTVDIKTKDCLISCNTNDIVYVEYNNRKTIVHTTEGDIYSVSGIDHWAETLVMPCFYQTHRSFIINMKYLKKIEKTTVTLFHKNHTYAAYLTARKYSDFVNRYLQYRGRNM